MHSRTRLQYCRGGRAVVLRGSTAGLGDDHSLSDSDPDPSSDDDGCGSEDEQGEEHPVGRDKRAALADVRGRRKDL